MAKEIKEKKAKNPVKRMSKEDQAKFDEIYDYLRYDILGYERSEDVIQSLPKHAVMRLKGLTCGKYMENSYIADKAKYKLDVVLNTFKFCKPEIMRALRSVSFTDEKHKINCVCRIVEDNLNTVYLRMKRNENVKKKTESMDMEIACNTDLSYANTNKKEKQNVGGSYKNKYNDLW